MDLKGQDNGRTIGVNPKRWKLTNQYTLIEVPKVFEYEWFYGSIQIWRPV